MKEISKKIIAIFVIMLMIINSSLLTIISVAAEDIKNVLDKSKAEVKIEINIEKYVFLTRICLCNILNLLIYRIGN